MLLVVLAWLGRQGAERIKQVKTMAYPQENMLAIAQSLRPLKKDAKRVPNLAGQDQKGTAVNRVRTAFNRILDLRINPASRETA